MPIPKIIMQTWKTTDIPDKWKPSQESILKILPDYKYVLMTDKDNRDFVIEYFPEYLEVYDSMPYPIQRADMIRPMWLYVNGGVYMDMDYEVLKDFSELFKVGDLFFMPSFNLGMFITNSFMASAPKHPFWLIYLEHMKQPASLLAITKHFEVMMTTGPMALTSCLQNSKTVYSILPQKFLAPCSICDDKCSDIENGYLKNLEGQSWNGWDSLAMNFVFCKWKYIVLFIILCILLWLIWRWKHPPPKMCVC